MSDEIRVSGAFTRQELLGHQKVETTQIYTHVLNKPGVGVRSPLDNFGVREEAGIFDGETDFEADWLAAGEGTGEVWVVADDEAGAGDVTALDSMDRSAPVRGSRKGAKTPRGEEADRRTMFVLKTRRLRRAMRGSG